jgi:hypothetical protein
MNLTELKACLRSHPEAIVRIDLPEGGSVPAHFHITEVGHIAKRFVDCGGTFRASETCVLQTWQASPNDDGHRLTAGRLAMILELANPLIPSGDLPVEVEYEHGLVVQFPLIAVAIEEPVLVLQLGLKHTDCLAKAKCGCGEGEAGATGPADENEACCAGPGCCA